MTKLATLCVLLSFVALMMSSCLNKSQQNENISQESFSNTAHREVNENIAASNDTFLRKISKKFNLTNELDETNLPETFQTPLYFSDSTKNKYSLGANLKWCNNCSYEKPIKYERTEQQIHNIDLRTTKCIGPIKKQGNCASSWAFAAVASFEYSYCRAMKNEKVVNLSEQYLIDCDEHNGGCIGGWHGQAMVRLAWNYFFTSDDYYRPSNGSSNGTCKKNVTVERFPNRVKGVYFDMVRVVGESVFRHNLVNHKVVCVAMSVIDSFFSYKEGVFYNANCNKYIINHAVVIVGFDEFSYQQDFWIVRNSWGTDWGEQGYFKIIKGDNTCNIESYGYSFHYDI